MKNTMTTKTANLLKKDVEKDAKTKYLESRLRIILSSKLALIKNSKPIPSIIYVIENNPESNQYKYISADKAFYGGNIEELEPRMIEKFRTFTREEAVLEKNKMIKKLKEFDDMSIVELIKNYIIEIEMCILDYDALVASLIEECDLEDLV